MKHHRNKQYRIFGFSLLIDRSNFQPLMLVMGLALTLGYSSTAAASGVPNILLIVADDLGYSDLGCYGSEISTPHLDELAAGGLRFTQFYNTGRCWPTRASILTGYYAQQIRRDTLPGIRSGTAGIRPEWARLLPQYLERIGYRSYHSGKWHVDGLPRANGFVRSYCLEDHDRYFSPRRHLEDDRPLPSPQAEGDYYATTAITDYALRYLTDHHRSYRDKPFFCYVAYTAPHFPLHARADDIAKYRMKYHNGWDVIRAARGRRLIDLEIIQCRPAEIERDLGPPYRFPEALKKLGPSEVDRPVPWDQLSNQQRRFQADKMAIHAAMVDRIDQEIGRIIAYLKATGQLANTLILFLSDNGASAEIMIRGDGHDPSAEPGSAKTFLCLGPGWSSACNTPFRRHKTWVHEGGIATPFIVHWPKGIPARGELRHTPGHCIDIVPTVIELTGLKWPATIDGRPVPPLPGRSLLPVFRKDCDLSRDYLWWQHEGNRAIRVGNWKAVAAGTDGPWELYDLASDRVEARDLARERPDTLRELVVRWAKVWKEFVELALRDLPIPSQPTPSQ